MRTMFAALMALVLSLTATAEDAPKQKTDHRTAELRLKVSPSGKQLWASVTVMGLTLCPREGAITVEWTSPSDYFESSRYRAPYHACKDGVAHTSAYRTIRIEEDGKTHEATGLWVVKVVSEDGDVLATRKARVGEEK